MPVVLEGYAPPYDPRICGPKSDSRSWRDRSEYPSRRHRGTSWSRNTTALYDLARESRLGTEKFMLDGQHSGTGGGNHVVIGGPTPGGQSVPAPPRSVAKPDRLLA